jgi:hypothetical protein
MTLYAIAERLHQPLFVVEQMSFEEISGWIAWFKIRESNRK